MFVVIIVVTIWVSGGVATVGRVEVTVVKTVDIGRVSVLNSVVVL